jgi:DNA-binding LacI/PurR family transcriptional regulator
MKSKATLKQIAKELNVSVSTVSKALNDSPEISEQTKTKVKEYAKLKNYKPNVIGLNLKNRKTKTIGVIIPNILNSFFAKVFKGIEKLAEEKGYNVITCISNESLEKEINTLEMLSNGTIDGFILSISEEAQKSNKIGGGLVIVNAEYGILKPILKYPIEQNQEQQINHHQNSTKQKHIFLRFADSAYRYIFLHHFLVHSSHGDGDHGSA